MTEKEYYQALSSCLSNAKDWHGYRLVRRQQQGAAVRRNLSGDKDSGRNSLVNGEKADESGDQDQGGIFKHE